MGWMYGGPYAELIGYAAHEGYAAAVLADGSETGIWSDEALGCTGYRSCCGCGWRGSLMHPASDAGEEQARAEWDRDHIRPMVDREASGRTVPASALVAFSRELWHMPGARPSSVALGLDVLLERFAQGDDPDLPGGER